MTTHTCPNCRFRFCDEDEEREAQIAERVAEWKAECVKNNKRIRGGYVSESVAGELLGIGPRALARHRRAESGPRYMDVDGCPVSYQLTELAAWEADHQKGESHKS